MCPAKGVKFCEYFSTLEIKRLHVNVHTLTEKMGHPGSPEPTFLHNPVALAEWSP